MKQGKKPTKSGSHIAKISPIQCCHGPAYDLTLPVKRYRRLLFHDFYLLKSTKTLFYSETESKGKQIFGDVCTFFSSLNASVEINSPVLLFHLLNATSSYNLFCIHIHINDYFIGSNSRRVVLSINEFCDILRTRFFEFLCMLVIKLEGFIIHLLLFNTFPSGNVILKIFPEQWF